MRKEGRSSMGTEDVEGMLQLGEEFSVHVTVHESEQICVHTIWRTSGLDLAFSSDECASFVLLVRSVPPQILGDRRDR